MSCEVQARNAHDQWRQDRRPYRRQRAAAGVLSRRRQFGTASISLCRGREKFRVIVPFHPGFGESDDDPAMSGIHDYVMHYLELFDALGLDKVNLVGFSLGGWLAASFAAEHGHRVERLALVGPAGSAWQEATRAAICSLVPAGEDPVVAGLGLRGHQTGCRKSPTSTSWATAIAKAARWRGCYGSIPTTPKFPRYLHRIKMPTLMVWGDEDKIIPVEHAEIWRSFIPKADIQIFKGAGHLVLDEKREAVDAVQQFLS